MKTEQTKTITMETLGKTLKTLCGKYDTYKVLKDWFKVVAITINNASEIVHGEAWQKRENEYLEIVKKYTKDEFQVFVQAFGQLVVVIDNDMQNGIFKDWLGELYTHSGVANKDKGQFFTPYSVGKLMTDMSVKSDLENIKDQDIITFNDCCVGGGCLPIAYCQALKENNINYQQRAVISCQDNDERCFYMTYIQLSLIGAVARVKLKDTLKNENLGMTWDTPALKMQYLKFRDVLRG